MHLLSGFGFSGSEYRDCLDLAVGLASYWYVIHAQQRKCSSTYTNTSRAFCSGKSTKVPTLQSAEALVQDSLLVSGGDKLRSWRCHLHMGQ